LEFVHKIPIENHGNDIGMHHEPKHVGVSPAGYFFVEGSEELVLPGRVTKVFTEETEYDNLVFYEFGIELFAQNLACIEGEEHDGIPRCSQFFVLERSQLAFFDLNVTSVVDDFLLLVACQ